MCHIQLKFKERVIVEETTTPSPQAPSLYFTSAPQNRDKKFDQFDHWKENANKDQLDTHQPLTCMVPWGLYGVQNQKRKSTNITLYFRLKSWTRSDYSGLEDLSGEIPGGGSVGKKIFFCCPM